MGRVLVTGGAGFIGSHLVDSLVGSGHEVHVIDNIEPQVHRSRPEYLNPQVRYEIRDIREDGILSKLIRQVDVVFHFASVVGVGQSMYQIERYIDSNVGGTARLLQALADKDHGVKKLVVASSMSIYGEGSYECLECGLIHPTLRSEEQLTKKEWEIRCPNCGQVIHPVATDEGKLIAPNSVYGVTKRDQEELSLVIGRAYGIPTVALRLFNVYGPRQSLHNPYTGVCAIFQSQIKNGKPPIVFEDGKQSRDFVSVRDVVQACLLAMERKGADYEAVNVGSGSPTSVLEVASELLRHYGSRLSPLVKDRFRVGDVRHCYADITKARDLLGYEPRVRFDEGMFELVSWGKAAHSTRRFPEAYEELRSRGLIVE